MAITVKEKEHWKNRIAEKIERRIEKLVATQQPAYLGETGRKAREAAIGILNLADTLARKNEVDEKIAQLKEQEELLDTIWLATSPTQVRELGRSVTTLLDETPTAPQEVALKTDPASDDRQCGLRVVEVTSNSD